MLFSCFRALLKVIVSQIDQFSLGPIEDPIGDVRREGGLVDTQVRSEAGGYRRCQRVVPYGRKNGA